MSGRTSIAVLLLLGTVAFCAPAPAAAQWPHRFLLDSRLADTLYSPSPTDPDRRYRVTAWGTYSMWEDTLNSSVDPVWIYEFPATEWEEDWQYLYPEGPPIYVGDPRLFDSHGLRFNHRPFPRRPIDSSHTYWYTFDGTGDPAMTTIVDWNVKGLQRVDAHDNNSGFLHVLVEELPIRSTELCGVDTSGFPSVAVGFRFLSGGSPTQAPDSLTVMENGAPIRIDSISCAPDRDPLSIALVLDRSGSMSESYGGRTRLEKVQESSRAFVDRMEAGDEGTLLSFSDFVRVDVGWTNSTNALAAGIDALSASGYTAVYDAIADAVAEVAARPDDRSRAVVVLSDGEDNSSSIRSIDPIIDSARAAGVSIWVLGLEIGSDDELRRIAEESGGAYLPISSPDEVSMAFDSVAGRLFQEDCCVIYYRSPDSTRNGVTRMVEMAAYYPRDTVLSAVTFYDPPDAGIGSVAYREPVTSGLLVSRGEYLKLSLPTTIAGDIRVVLRDASGRQVMAERHSSGTTNLVRFQMPSLAPGIYFLAIYHNETLALIGTIYLID